MSKPNAVRRYGKRSKKPQAAGRLFVELPQTPIRTVKTELVDEHVSDEDDEVVANLTHNFSTIKIEDGDIESTESTESTKSPSPPRRRTRQSVLLDSPESKAIKPLTPPKSVSAPSKSEVAGEEEASIIPSLPRELEELQILSWGEVCPPGDTIVKIAEASYAEVYRVANERGTSIIKVIRMSSPIKRQTKTQQKSGLVDEEPHSESDLQGELRISEWVADIPGFVVYKERYIVQGKACRELLETHQVFHKKLKRQDPDRLQFYPSPSRYLDDTKFLVVELGDAGTALEDFELATPDQLWDIFFHVAIALARAEARIDFEHRDLHEGNLCIRKVSEPIPKDDRDRTGYFGFSGLEITILDYGLSRAQADYDSEPVAYDLERDLSIFTSEHAAQCRVYRQMRSFLLRGDRVCLPPEGHKEAYADGIDGPITWTIHEPYTNVLWLAYLYEWMVEHYRGPKKEVSSFKRATKEFWSYLAPEADDSMPGFESASDILRYAVEIGWLDEDQLMGGRDEVEKSILSILTTDGVEGGVADPSLRRSPRRRRPAAV
ncbi:hypothetical protein E0Z10_g8089 [Xylaria hypoxylon]|uniref:non-specific serine/threonine protein kinase n=1 Tax=Xylaria hypoxylon TaxID=37992 RepID=A0A4Z0Y955_9PEZI|nr:hypothetical protein E0Z10_g8089 [Xylaria hypoxylon]